MAAGGVRGGSMRRRWGAVLLLLGAGLVVPADGVSCCDQCLSGKIYRSGVEISTREFLVQEYDKTPEQLGAICLTQSPVCQANNCPAGQEKPRNDCRGACVGCGEAYYSTGGSYGCQICPAGYRCWYGFREACPARNYQPSEGQTECLGCPYNKYQLESGQPNCRTCEVGYKCYFGLREACPAGQYQPREGEQTCLECPANTYQPSTGQASCLPCTSPCAAGYKTVQECVATSTNRVCAQCTTPSTTLNGASGTCNECVRPRYPVAGTETCLACAPGYYNQNMPGAFVCSQCVCTGIGQVYVACPAGSTAQSCLACKGGDNDASYTCPVGTQPSVVCDGTQTTNAVCANCPAGKQKPTSTDKWCAKCPDGRYKAAASTAICTACTNKLPASTGVAVYDAWASTAARTTNTCPWSCVAGYYRPASGACAACNATRGTWAPAGTTKQCLACLSKPANSYYQQPRGFDGRSNTSSNSCPW